MLLLRTLMCLLVVQVSGPAFGQLSNDFDDPFGDEPEYLPVDQAFMFDFNQDQQDLTVSFTIAEGYYLYKKQFKYVAKNAEIGEASYPKGNIIEDEFYGESEVFHQQVDIHIPLTQVSADGIVKVRYQGCAEAGLCYPPTVKVVYVDALAKSPAHGSTATSEQYSLADKLINKDNLALTLLLFLALGIGLAFTPCVFPMYPIVSGIVIGQGKPKGLSHSFWLTFVYVQGMAITYSLLGVAVAVAGAQFQAALQHPVVLSVFIGLFVLLAVALFGGFELQLPAKWQERLTHLSNNQTAGSFAGVFVMGVLSGLIASPCTTA
ncbi:MAG TPA: protein-disulfide reductase DsbD, partial [Alteromonas australica]|nr:protein-disulfide reductase DsbD [Alteromonas australica]